MPAMPVFPTPVSPTKLAMPPGVVTMSPGRLGTRRNEKPGTVGLTSTRRAWFMFDDRHLLGGCLRHQGIEVRLASLVVRAARLLEALEVRVVRAAGSAHERDFGARLEGALSDLDRVLVAGKSRGENGERGEGSREQRAAHQRDPSGLEARGGDGLPTLATTVA